MGSLWVPGDAALKDSMGPCLYSFFFFMFFYSLAIFLSLTGCCNSVLTLTQSSGKQNLRESEQTPFLCEIGAQAFATVTECWLTIVESVPGLDKPLSETRGLKLSSTFAPFVWNTKLPLALWCPLNRCQSPSSNCHSVQPNRTDTSLSHSMLDSLALPFLGHWFSLPLS